MTSALGTGVRVAALVTFTALAGCGGKQEPAPSPPPPSAPATLAGDAGAAVLPSGHPPVEGAQRGGHGGAPSGVGGLTWKTPAGWKEETPSSGMRRAQYRVSGPGGDAECVVFYFGAGEGGDARSNAERWAGQFTRGDGKPAELETSALAGAPVEVTMVEVRGTYHGGPTMGAANAPRPVPDSMLLGAIAKGPDANWFWKFTGPEKTVNAHRTAFEGMLRSLEKSR
jgi:hypothetical protein